MPRLDIERQIFLEPKRIKYAVDNLSAKGFDVYFESLNEVRFKYKGFEICYFPYSGWHTGKTIKDGRGFSKLLNQLNRGIE